MTKTLRRLRQLQVLLWTFMASWVVVWFVGHAPACNFAAWPASNGNACRFLKIAYDWQNVLAGFFAIAAAFVGGFFIQQ